MSHTQSCCQPMFFIYLLISCSLVLFAGIMSGLTLGLMSLSLVDLEVLVKAGKPQDQLNAAKILPVVKNQHLLLCTLLIGNSLAMEALPIFLDALVPAWGAILISVTLILAFGEIIPQAVCTQYGLSVGAKMAPIVRILLVVFFPVAYPISKLLDWVLGKGHFALMRRAELKTLVGMHGNEAGKGGELTHDETTIITGALDLTQKTAQDSMTPISHIFSLDINAKLDMHTLGLIMSKGHSRVPIYSGSPTNIIGLILVKNLITCRPEEEVPIRNVTIRKIPRVYDDLPLYDILNEFQKGHSHMAVVVKRNKENNGSRIMNGDKPRTILAEHLAASSSPANITQSPLNLKRTNQETPRQQAKRFDKSERSRKNNILDLNNSEALPNYFDEQVVGIITMEDVMEELLQEEILDETDEYVDVHNKIKINMLPPKKSSPSPVLIRKTPNTSPLYNNSNINNNGTNNNTYTNTNNNSNNNNGLCSPLSPYHDNNTTNNCNNDDNNSNNNNNNNYYYYYNNNDVLSSPISQTYEQPPNYSPNMIFSPPKSWPASPSHRVSRKSYEKIKKEGEKS